MANYLPWTKFKDKWKVERDCAAYMADQRVDISNIQKSNKKNSNRGKTLNKQ